jgi:hypothetical protein
LASQRITVAKIGGLAGDVALQRLQAWSGARTTTNPNEWSTDQWPKYVRTEADDFANQLRAHSLTLPVVHFVEWVDMWSMGNIFEKWLRPPDCPMPLCVYADQFEIFAYRLPDEGRLARHLAAAGPRQFVEEDWFVARLLEAVEAWQELVEQAVLVVLRLTSGPLVSDEEVTASLRKAPDWLSGERRRSTGCA